ncbi:family 43 glycosylhydrolase [Streptomyces sp. CWNU-52B]|uniref:glycoside hydrolase family 43 protein n=1 Tax=unclassified Streptomyces TaxID=2593676 RepID=UPI0039BF8F5D
MAPGAGGRQGARAFSADLGDGTYRNPVLNADWSDPDLLRVGDDYYLTASSFGRAPGLPLLHSRDLVNWTLVGHALQRLEPARDFAKPRHDCGVWAPSLRHHDDRYWIFWGDPDHGVYQVNAPEIRGPWTRPHLVKEGRGLIDACPLWDEESGEAYLVHGWARSRSGIKNRLTGHRMRPDGTGLLDEGKLIVDGDRIPGWFTLEGPKLYRHDGWFWIFAPAGGVATGWQGALRSRGFFGPYEERVVLEQGDTDVNGPPQDGWATQHSGDGLRLSCVRTADAHDLRKLPSVLTQRLPGAPCAVEVELRLDAEEPGARAGLAVLGDAFSWIGLERGADGTVHLVHRFAESVAERERDAAHPRMAPEGRVRLRIEAGAGARCRFFFDLGTGWESSGQVFAATPWRWVGALLGLFGAAPAGAGHAGAATFTRFRITAPPA